tara:strand:- start:1298 stop:3208 length:1911 start_codon:yes stop_codon:yes gene_type:complete
MLSTEHIINEILEYNPKADVNLVRKAYTFSKQAHEGQVRDSGEPYFEHCVATAEILIQMNLDSATIAAGLLHDILEDTKIKEKEFQQEFGKEVLDLVQGVTKIRKIDIGETEERKAATVRKILLATSKDIRVILIKLADRLHNMRTLKHKQEKIQKKIAQESLEIYAPIAHKLGMYKVKSELEDLSLRYLHPNIYQDIKKQIAEKRIERDTRFNTIMSLIKEKLKQKNIQVTYIYGRVKTFYSIYKKIVKRGYKFEDISDLIAIRIITKNNEDCYRALGILHSNWKYLPNKFQDFIANPKPNGYQSIHTKILFEKKPVEVQIRTKDMHIEAEEGIAAHWRYKGTERDKKFDRKIAWLRQFLDWQRTSKSAKDLIETVKIDLFKDEIIVFTPKGDPIALPEESTPIDFAYEIHSGIGNKCARAKVNTKLVSLSHKLRSGDIVEIMTQNKIKPSRHWLTFARTNNAKAKIRQALGIQFDDKKQKKYDDINKKKIKKQIIVKNVKDPIIKFSRCCETTPGEEIVGFKTKDKKITIHSKNCPNVDSMLNLKRINVQWKEIKKKENIKQLIITVQDRVGLLADILNVISAAKLSIKSLNTEPKRQNIQINMKLDIKDKEILKKLMNYIKAIPGTVGVNVIE